MEGPNREDKDIEIKETEETEEKPQEDSKSPEECFGCRLKSFGDLYLHLVVGVGVLLALAIWLGVKIHVMVGLGTAVVAVCVYAVTLAEGMKNKLGLAYNRVSGGASLTVVDPQKEVKWDAERRYIPSRIMWLDVVEIGGRNPKQKADGNVKILCVPSTVKKIDKDAFEGMTALEKIVYDGTAEEWTNVEILADTDGIEVEFKAEN